MNICFLMYPWDRVAPETDTTLRMIHEAASRRHKVAILMPKNLTIRESMTFGFCRMLKREEKVPQNIMSFYKKAEFKEQLVPMSGFDVIFVRTNPPLDPVMLNFLDSVKDDTFIVNDIDGLRKANNKLYSAAFEDPENKIIPITHVSKNKDYLKKVIKESDSEKMILKPLEGYGGSGVIVIEKTAMQSVTSLLDFYITGKRGEDHYVILQEYLEGAKDGDVRVLMLNGEAIGAMKRVPSSDDVRANVHAGGTAHKHVLTKEEKALCKKIGPKLVADGLYFVGLDLIGGKLIEINVCSPGGITRINAFNRVKLQQKVLDFVENVVSNKEKAIARKHAFRKKIEDA
ncbi:glutathione synthase [Flammeovirgaceae bacterium SG7u.111]|nr:glutathione synthase [Flammeovirgaceae bacterium SG7u.132]WPO34546.1 glutathione synthase [Flammeovirgaceae bacterium SG7u.111]